MDRHEAQRRLLAHRAGEDDPFFAEALEAARRDPALAAWLEREGALDAALVAKLRAVPIPAGLKERLLAIPTTRPERPAPVPVPLRPLARRGRVARVFALALTVAALAVGFTLHGAGPVFADYEGEIAEQIACGEVDHLAYTASQADALRAWLAAHGAPANIAIPAGTARLPSVGCRTFSWRGRPVSQICFALEDGKIVHLFVVGGERWRSAPPEGHPEFQTHGAWTTASWRDAGATYIMAREGDQADVAKLFL